MSSRLVVLLSGMILLIAGLVVTAVQVVLIERDELEYVTPWRSLAELRKQPESTRISARIGEVDLEAGEIALFELCARDPLRAQIWENAFDVLVWNPARHEPAFKKVPLDAGELAEVKRNAEGACWTVKTARVKLDGHYAMDIAWPGRDDVPAELRNVPLRARVLGKPPLGAREAALVLCAALGAMLCVFAGFSPRDQAPHPKRATAPWAVLGTLLAAGLAALVLRLPIPGSVGGLARGLGLAAVEVAVAVGFGLVLYASERAGLGLYAPEKRASAWLFAAVGCAAVLNPLARWAMAVIPASGEAPIEAFISWPSGALAFAALGMAVPLAEELFFRGFVFGALEPLGLVPAFFGTITLFASVHAQQAWGNWGALLSVAVTGIVLTLLRTLSGSTLVPAVAHLLYNLSLWRGSFGG